MRSLPELCLVLVLLVSEPLLAVSSSQTCPSAMVSTSHPLASQIGAQILADGGNAVDAAIAVHLALNVVEPMMSGIGGGGFMMIYLADEEKVVVIDFREMAPKAAYPEMFLNSDGTPMEFEDAVRSGRSVGVPGTVSGLFTAHELYGSMEFAELIDPAIELAERGHRVNRVLAESIEENMDKFNDAARPAFAPDGKPLPEGTLLVQPDLARTFRLLRDYGPSAFYGDAGLWERLRAGKHGGEIGRAIVTTVQSEGGIMSVKDLGNYTVKFREPVRGTYRGYEIVTMPPPSSGGLTLLQMLKILEGFDIKNMGPYAPETMHVMIETMHLAYADRNGYLGDDDFVEIPHEGYLNPEYIAERRALINMSAANPDVEPGDPWKYEREQQEAVYENVSEERCGETTHFTVKDRWGNIVCCTTTIEQAFGSGIMVPGYGFMLNNEMTDFDFIPGGANQAEANKRPRSSMAPTIVFKDGSPAFTVGSPGGSTIIATVLEVIVNMIDHGMSVQEAIDAPRFFSSSYPIVSWEEGIPESTILKLESMGHRFDSSPQVQGSVQSIVINHGVLEGGADLRREGTVVSVL